MKVSEQWPFPLDAYLQLFGNEDDLLNFSCNNIVNDFLVNKCVDISIFSFKSQAGVPKRIGSSWGAEKQIILKNDEAERET